MPPSGSSLCPLVGSSGSDAVCTRITGDTNDRLSILYDGFIDFGDGSNAPDTRIQRVAANELTISGATVNLRTINTSVSNSTTNVITATNTSEGVNPTFAVKSGGQHEFGAGNNPADTFLYRSSATNLTLSTTSLGSPDAHLRLGTIYTNLIITNSGDLFISPVGSNINVDSRNINNVNSMLFNAAGLTRIQGTSNGTMSITDNGGAIGTLQVGTVNATSGDLSLNSATSDIELNLCNLNNSSNIDNDNIIYSSYLYLDKQQPTTDVLITKVPSLSENSFQLRADGIMSWGSSSAPVDTYFRRFASPGVMTIAGSTSGSAGGELYVDLLRSGTALSIRSNSGNITIRPSATDLIMCRDNNSNDRIHIDPTNAGIGFTAAGSNTSDTFLRRTAFSTLSLGASGGSVNGTMRAGTFSINTVGETLLRSALTGVLQVRNSSNAGGSGQINLGTVYGEGGGTLTLNSDLGIIDCSNNRLSSTRVVEVNGSLTNTINSSTAQSKVVGSGNTTSSATTNSGIVGSANALSNTATAGFISGNGNTINNSSNSGIVGCSGVNLNFASGSAQANGAIGSRDIVFGAGTGTNNTCCVAIATAFGGLSSIASNVSNVLLKGSRISANQSNSVVFGDDANGFSGTTTLGVANIFQCHMRGGYYFTSNATRDVGVRVDPGDNKWLAISDARLKNIERKIPVEVAHEAIDKVEVYNYTWKSDEEQKRKLGMVAQEVNSAFSEFMPRHEAEGHQYSLDHPDEAPIETVCSGEIAFISLALIKHQKKLISDLTAENMALKDIVIDLIKRVEVLEKNGTASAAKPARRTKKINE